VPARRFFVEDVHAAGDVVRIDGSDAHKIARVLRLQSGDRIEMVDSAGTVFDALLRIDDESVEATLLSALERTPQVQLAVDVAQGLPKGAKMDFVVEKLTELGASAILPFTSERSIVRDLGDAKLERWRRLARSAAQQCGRHSVPAIEDAVTFDALCDRFASYDVVLFPWEVAAREPLRDTLPPLVTSARRVLVVIGPEGGFSHAEAERAKAAGAHLVSLGSRVLRTETAAMVVLAVLGYERDVLI
jgi:16S rRNA (uracil1498-N3)-methyltransferase